MGFRELTLKLPLEYDAEELQRIVQKKLKISECTIRIDRQSLDARKRSNIHWQTRVIVTSAQLSGPERPHQPRLEIDYCKNRGKVLVVGSGPAGFFAAFALQKSGFQVTLIERGSDVDERAAGIADFEEKANFHQNSNYAFGEGGAGTFSDGKLTSRTKNITLEKNFILDAYVQAGAPKEILYLAHPHVGSDHLKIVVKNLRYALQELGGKILFNTRLYDLEIQNSEVKYADTSAGQITADYFILATGHSAFETYRMLIKRGVPFQPKNFAIGCRVEHPQKLINKAQWGVEKLAGVKAAEYRLTWRDDQHFPVYTFCMCPGGLVVPATAYAENNIVNGMSLYQRDGRFANAACVAGFHLEKLLNRDISALETLDWVENLEHQFYDFTSSYQAPFCSIQDFLNKKESTGKFQSSYPLGIIAAPLWEMLPTTIVRSMQNGLRHFSKKLRGFEKGILLGLESKTSAPIQVLRQEDKSCAGIENLYLVGEGSGWAGGIISSGVDGLKSALSILNKQ